MAVWYVLSAHLLAGGETLCNVIIKGHSGTIFTLE